MVQSFWSEHWVSHYFSHDVRGEAWTWKVGVGWQISISVALTPLISVLLHSIELTLTPGRIPSHHSFTPLHFLKQVTRAAF